MDIKKLGKVCKDYRINILKVSLTNFARVNNEKLQNIHAFEQGRANNIKYIYLYMFSSDKQQLEILINNLFYDVIKL